MGDSEGTIDAFRRTIERSVWGHSNLSLEARADVLREFVDELEAEDSKFDDWEAHADHVMKETTRYFHNDGESFEWEAGGGDD